MLRTCVDLQLRDLLTREPVLREHAFDGGAEDLFGPAVELFPQRSAAQSTRIARVTVVALLVELVPGHADLLGVHDDDEIAGVDVRGVRRLSLPAQNVGDAGREPAERLPVGVHDVPVAGDLTRFGGIGLHASKRRTWASAGAKL